LPEVKTIYVCLLESCVLSGIEAYTGVRGVNDLHCDCNENFIYVE